MTFLRNIKYIAAIILIIAPLTSSANATQEGAKKFIKNVSEQAITLIMDENANETLKEAQLIKLFEDSVDTKWIAKFVMGRYWRDASSLQKEQYIKLHKQFLVSSYIPKFKEYTNQKIALKKTYDEGSNEYMIETEIVQSDGPNIKVDYKVRKDANNKYMIYDVIAEGVSLINTQRSEFGSILSRKGVDYLIKKLKARV